MQQLAVLIRAELRPEKDVWLWPYYSLVIHSNGTVEWVPEMIEESEAHTMVAEFLERQAQGKVFVN